MTGKPGSAETPADANKAPGRTTGFLIMSAMIVFVAIFMAQQDRSAESLRETDLATAGTEIEGFRADAWYLPDDPHLGFVEIPAGSFVMGSNPAVDRMAYENERWSGLQRQGEVYLPLFYIARFETTVAQFNEFARATGLGQAAVDSTVPRDFPVNNVTWPEALAYGRWLEAQLRASDATPVVLRRILDNGGRVTLPSEAEWEKAARGTDGRIFPWGSRPSDQYANFQNDSRVPVGSFDCGGCAHNLADMAGNVWELTRSPLQDYPFDPDDDKQTLTGDALWVMRGGSYADGINNVRTAVRGAVDPGVRNDTIGFRVVISTR